MEDVKMKVVLKPLTSTQLGRTRYTTIGCADILGASSEHVSEHGSFHVHDPKNKDPADDPKNLDCRVFLSAREDDT